MHALRDGQHGDAGGRAGGGGDEGALEQPPDDAAQRRRVLGLSCARMGGRVYSTWLRSGSDVGCSIDPSAEDIKKTSAAHTSRQRCALVLRRRTQLFPQ